MIADISGSVASFARFTLHFVLRDQSEFSKVRSFVFIDGIDEVTRFFDAADDPAVAVHRINTEADVVWVDGHSDYGHALAVFNQRWGDQVTSRASVLILGDARNNYHATEAWVLEELRTRPDTSTGSTRSPATTGHRGTRSSPTMRSTATGSSSAGRSASSNGSSATSPDRRPT